MDLNSVLIAGGVSAIIAMLVRMLPITSRFALTNDVRSRVRELEAQYQELTKQNGILRTEYSDKLVEFTNAFVEWSAREKSYQAQIERLEAEVSRLRVRIRELEARAGVEQEKATVVLGVWPDRDLDYQAEADALYNAGFEYRSLIGDEATRRNVIYELQRSPDIRIVEIGAHGVDAGTLLHDGVATPRWWADVLSMYSVQLVVLMACESDGVGDALYKAGIQSVISLQRQVEDGEAVIFVRELYRGLADRLDLPAAVSMAKLFVSRETAEMIRLREH